MDVPDGPLQKAAAVAIWAPGASALVALTAGAGRAGRIALAASSLDASSPSPSSWKILRVLHALTHPFVSQEEADVFLDRVPTKSDASQASLRRQRHRSVFLSVTALLQAASFAIPAVEAGTAFSESAARVANAAAWILVTVWALRCPAIPSFLIATVVFIAFGSALVRFLAYLPDLSFDWATAALALDVSLSLAALILILAMPVQAGGYTGQVSEEERDRVMFMTDPTRSAQTLPPEAERMTDNYDLAPTTPEDYTTLFSALTYYWMGGIMNLATRRTLRPDDIWRMRTINDTLLLFSKYARLLPRFPSGAGLLRRLIRLSAYDAFLDMVWKMGGVALNYAGPALSKRILECIEEDNRGQQPADGRWTPRREALVWAMCALLVATFRQVAELINFHQARQVGMRIRQMLTVELFDKTLRTKVALAAPKATGSASATAPAHPSSETTPPNMSDTASTLTAESDESAVSDQEVTEESSQSTGTDVGIVVNMMATDINNLLRMGCDLHNLYGAPIEILIASLFLYSLLGSSALVGIGVLAFSVPVNYYTGNIMKYVSSTYQQKRDRRIALETEMFRAIRYIKAQGLDSLWESRVRRARNAELWALAKYRICTTLIAIYWAAVPLSTALLVFGLYTIVSGNHLTIPVAFTSVSLFAMLRGPLEVLPTFMSLFIQAWVSIRRLETFLSEAEVSRIPDVVALKGKDDRDETPPTVQICDAVFTWPKPAYLERDDAVASTSFRLRVSELTLPPRGLCVVEGKTASGKSALLLALLGEMDQQGTLRRTPFISYQAQSTWLEGGSSVRSNILFGSPYDPERYDLAVSSSALDTDLADKETFPQGDNTRVSVQTLSGGQRARLALARALYAPQARLILLDDCLSAVDAHIQRRIVEQALLGPLGASSSNRLVVIATHHAHLLRAYADVILHIEHGHVSTQYQSPAPITPSAHLSNGTSKQPQDKQQATFAADRKRNLASSQELLYKNEARREGVTSWVALNGYIAASGYLVWFGYLIVMGIQWFFDLSEQLWVRKWGEQGPASEHPRHQDPYYLLGYGVILFLGISAVTARYVYLYIGAQRASRSIHRSLLRTILAATPRWHDSVPVGRLINLFSADMMVVDQDLPNSITNTLSKVIWFLGSLVVIVIFVPGFLVPITILVAIGPRYVRGFMAAMRDMQRIQSVVASPIYTFFGQVMEGSPTIRAFSQQGRLRADMIHLTSAFMSNWWAVCSMEVWLQVRVGVLGAVSVWIVTLLCLGKLPMDAGAAGIALSVASNVPQILYMILRNYQQLANQTNSLERVDTYSQAPPETESTALPPPNPHPQWPAFGRIEVRDVWARYDAHLPWVLKGVGFIAEPGKKIGILGRSGSGKSSLISTLLRLLPINRGTISIDGVDIKHVPLTTLRHRIAVCPQEPILFSGTVRFNVDPFQRSTDASIMNVLTALERGVSRRRTSQKSDSASREPGSRTHPDTQPTLHYHMHQHHLHLDDVVAPGGQNLSAGQRQVVSLARALVAQPKVLLLDEATANTDHLTDAKIQGVLEQLGCTLVTVAHRLRTVIMYDCVHIMDKGQIVESGAPKTLLLDPKSKLAQMALATGGSEMQELQRLAGV